MKPYTFHHVRLRGFGENFPSEWVLAVHDAGELERVNRIKHSKMFTDSLKDYLHATARDVQRDHFRNITTVLIVKRAESHGKSFIDAGVSLFSQVDENQREVLGEGKTIFMRSCGSYTWDDGRYDIIETQYNDKLIFPNSGGVRFMQWPGGRHWYAKLGDEDVRVDGAMKWDTREEAELAAKKYVETKNPLEGGPGGGDDVQIVKNR